MPVKRHKVLLHWIYHGLLVDDRPTVSIIRVQGVDADAGELREDIFDINLESKKELFEGDIVGDIRRNAILDETKRWKFPIPYILTDSLELNAKGVILQAMEMYRLKSCVDFKPYEDESTYISFSKQDGCWSYVGDFQTGQDLSIGERCDTKAIVEHELLHALGFYHEQSRSDRDDYVQIWWDQIIPGKEHNFNKYEDDFITDLNTPYDYESIMHYRPLSFNKNASIPTITTAIPAFNDVIGQRLDFSAVDIERLNRMYDCASTLTLLDQCAFEQINICGMIQNEADGADWVQTVTSPGDQDHTLGGKCRDAGYFMKFDTSNKEVGHSALLESRILYPKRKQQCLQFFYKTTGGAGDLLTIWVRTDDGTGNVRQMQKVHTITGDSDESWKIAHVTLNAEKKFRYIFQGTVGSKKTSGGIFIDDVTLSEMACPNAVWQIRNFTHLLTSMPQWDSIRSERFFSSEGYSYGISVYPNGRNSSGYLAVTFNLYSGENDAVLEWPAANRQVTITVMDQDPDVTQQMSNSRSFTTDTNPRWNKPSTTGVFDESCQCFRSSDYGWSTFMSHQQLSRRSFLKNDDLIVTVNVDDLTHLIKTEVPVKPKTSIDLQAVEQNHEAPKPRRARSVRDHCQPNPCLNGGVCVQNEGKATCRCASGKAVVYSGDMCEKQHVDGGIMGVFIGGIAGTVVLTGAIIAVLRKPH
ncbi:meprin A subunit alpha [Chanos chanos]|uniref:Meprin A subunit n=1 Tax=Chanos chanos TaxID=29144 RepID=A0A6J2V518_CHACN|nr:meprin A subunit alpha-like [Chanos chanos]